MEVTTTLGQRIREIRRNKGLTQSELTKGICTPSMCSQIESDRARPSYKMLAMLAERLEVPMEKLISDVDLNLEFTSTLKMARAMVAAKEYAAVLPMLHELLEAPNGMVSRTEVLFDLAVSYLHTGDLEQAEHYFSELKELALLRQDHPVLTRILLHSGQIAMERKLYQLAIYQWRQAVELLDKTQEPDALLKENLLYRLGQAHSKLGSVRDAVACYQQALQASDGADSLYKVGRLYLALAKSEKRMGNFQQAIPYAEQAAHVYQTLDRISMKTLLDLECAVMYGQTGREQEAIRLLHTVIRKLQDMGKQTEAGIAFVELAKIHAQMGDVAQAEETCHVARTLLPELHAYQGWVHRILGELAKENGYREEAIRRFERAADCFKSMDQVEEWEQTMYDLSRLYQDVHKPERALLVMDALRNFTREVLTERGIVL